MPERFFDLSSDLHLDFYDDMSDEVIRLWEPSADILVIAGDTFNGIGSSQQHIDALAKLRAKYRDVVMVMGNHDYFELDMDKGLENFRRVCAKLGIHGLENEVVEVGGISFAGTTLWYPYNDHKPARFADFHYIGGFTQRVNHKNLDARDFIGVLRGVEVVISHHIPTKLGIHNKYLTAPNNHFYVNPIEELIIAAAPKVWCYGHTHEHMSFELGETRLYCHPRGYPFEGGDVFQPKAIIV